MYTGTQKKAIVLKNNDNCIFEEAYFILKDDFTSVKESEMVREANKILKNNIIGGYFLDNEKKDAPQPKKFNLTSFLLGAWISIVICTLLFLLVK